MSFKSFVLFLFVAGCGNDRPRADRIAPDTVPQVPGIDSSGPAMNTLAATDSSETRQVREIASLIAAAVPEIVRFPLDSFPDVPPNVRTELNNLGCLIPQSDSPKPHNVIRGKFAAPNQDDWAALCSIADTSMMVIVWGGPVRCPTPIERGSDGRWMQGIGEGKFGFSRAIGVATIAEIDQHAEWYEGPAAPARDHDGIDHAFIGKASTVLFCHQGKWVELQGAD